MPTGSGRVDESTFNSAAEGEEMGVRGNISQQTEPWSRTQKKLGFPSRMDGWGIPGGGNSLGNALIQAIPSFPGTHPTSAGCTSKKCPFQNTLRREQNRAPHCEQTLSRGLVQEAAPVTP